MNGSECLVLGAVQTNDKLCCKNNVSLNSTKSLVAFSFGNVGAKEKAHKKKSAEKGISRSVEREEASAASTAPPFEKRRAKTFNHFDSANTFVCKLNGSEC